MTPFLPALRIPRAPRKFPTLLAAVITGALGGAMREPVARWVAERSVPTQDYGSTAVFIEPGGDFGFETLTVDWATTADAGALLRIEPNKPNRFACRDGNVYAMMVEATTGPDLTIDCDGLVKIGADVVGVIDVSGFDYCKEE